MQSKFLLNILILPTFITFSILISCSGNKEDGHISMKSNTPEAFNTRSTKAEQTSTKGHDITASEFKEKIFDYSKEKEWKYKYDKPIVIDFYANWCKPCKILEPRLKSVISSYNGEVELFKVNIDKERELASIFQVQSVPTLLFCPTGDKQPFALQGLQPEQQLKQAIDKIRTMSPDRK